MLGQGSLCPLGYNRHGRGGDCGDEDAPVRVVVTIVVVGAERGDHDRVDAVVTFTAGDFCK